MGADVGDELGYGVGLPTTYVGDDDGAAVGDAVGLVVGYTVGAPGE